MIKPKKKIIPILEKCAECKIKAVKNHHFLCDKCWGKKRKRLNNKKRNELVKQANRAKKRKEMIEQNYEEKTNLIEQLESYRYIITEPDDYTVEQLKEILNKIKNEN